MSDLHTEELREASRAVDRALREEFRKNPVKTTVEALGYISFILMLLGLTLYYYHLGGLF
jgi:hypothetical protein